MYTDEQWLTETTKLLSVMSPEEYYEVTNQIATLIYVEGCPPTELIEVITHGTALELFKLITGLGEATTKELYQLALSVYETYHPDAELESEDGLTIIDDSE